eukprot:COSAG06_NODE_5314_length_3569_cov_1.562248_2_plen_199_part_00
MRKACLTAFGLSKNGYSCAMAPRASPIERLPFPEESNLRNSVARSGPVSGTIPCGAARLGVSGGSVGTLDMVAARRAEAEAATQANACAPRTHAQNTRARARAGGTNPTRRAPHSNQQAAGCAGAISGQPARIGHAPDTRHLFFSLFHHCQSESAPLQPGQFRSKPRIIAPEPIKGSVASAFSSTKEWVEVPERRANG